MRFFTSRLAVAAVLAAATVSAEGEQVLFKAGVTGVELNIARTNLHMTGELAYTPPYSLTLSPRLLSLPPQGNSSQLT
jgi:hypothetical protein